MNNIIRVLIVGRQLMSFQYSYHNPLIVPCPTFAGYLAILGIDSLNRSVQLEVHVERH